MPSLKSRNLSTIGIVLKKVNFSEFDQFITIFSKEHGHLEFVAKGIRKIDSHLSGHLESMNICNFQLYKGPKNYIVTHGAVITNYKNIRQNLEKTLLATLICEIFYRTTLTHDGSEELFSLLNTTLDLIEDDLDETIEIERFKLRLLNILGVLPDISVCSFCHKRWQQEDKIIVDGDGHISCGICNKARSNPQEISFNIMKLINFLCQNQTAKIKLDHSQKSTLKQIVNLFLLNYLGKEIATEKILESLIKN